MNTLNVELMKAFESMIDDNDNVQDYIADELLTAEFVKLLNDAK